MYINFYGTSKVLHSLSFPSVIWTLSFPKYSVSTSLVIPYHYYSGPVVFLKETMCQRGIHRGKGTYREVDPVFYTEQKHICRLEKDNEETTDYLIVMSSPRSMKGLPKMQSILLSFHI